MSKMFTYVVFTPTDAKIIESDKELAFKERFIINPEFSLVEGIPTKYWTYENNDLIPMSYFQKNVRDLIINRNGISDTVTYDLSKISNRRRFKTKAALISLFVCSICYVLLKIYLPLKVLHD